MKPFVCLICCIGLLLSVCGCTPVVGTGRMIYYEGDQIPVNLDPLLAQSVTERLVVSHLFQPLLNTNESGQPTDGAAQLPTLSADRLTYTFTLRQDGLWEDRVPVTANDFVFGLQRAVDPRTKATCADQLTSIKGAKEILAGLADPASLGVEAPDSRTLIITLTHPDAGLLTVLSGVAGMPCRKDFFEASGGRYGMDRDHLLTNGGFTLSRWIKEEKEELLRLSRSDSYYGKKEIAPAGITVTFSGEGDRMFRFSQGDVDCAPLSMEQLAQAKTAGLNTLSYINDCYALVLNTNPEKPTGNLQLRKALVGAMDLQGLSSHLPVSCQSAQSLMVPGQYCGSTVYTPPPTGQEGLAALAIQNFNSAMKVLEAEAVKALTLGYPDREGIRPVLDYLAQCWQKDFGIYVTLSPLSDSAITAALQNGSFDLLLCPMQNQSKQPAEVLDQFSSQSGQSLGSLTDEAYDALLANRFTTSDPLPVLQQCEGYLTGQCIAFPLFYSREYYGYSKSVSGITVNTFPRLPNFTKTEKFR